MRAPDHVRTVALAIAFLTLTSACGGGDGSSDQSTSGAAPSNGAEPAASTTEATTRDLSAQDLDGYAKGLARETELVREAQERARTATTPQERGDAQQAQWEDQTIPEGAKASGLDADRYRVVRNTVNTTFRWLDFQGKIDGPMQLDTTTAPPDMKARLARDPFDALSPASRTELQAQMNRLVPAWIEYVKLTAVAG
jgi:hypothetical protein